MNRNDKENLYRLFRDHEDVLGSSGTTVVALESFIRSIEQVRCTRDSIGELILELTGAIQETEPKIIPLIHLIEQFEAELKPYFDQDLDRIKAEARRILQEKIELFQENTRRVTEHGIGFVSDGDVILAHSASTCVINVLVKAWEVGKKRFRVLILKQDLVKTRQLVNALSRAGVQHRIIPEYDLSHHLSEATKLFVGGMSVTPDQRVVSALGTSNIVGLCHFHHVPVYLFVNSLKFAHQTGRNQHIHTKEAQVSGKGFSLKLTTHSHDLLDLALVDHLVTERGEIQREPLSRMPGSKAAESETQ